jgi:hydroxymethylglutaryl-CoA lyase
MARRIHMQEVGLRDGLQIEPQFVPDRRQDRAGQRLVASAGMAKIEVTSFTSPKAIPRCATPRS